jgi:riboflavin synthase alpha subunit
MFTGLIESVGEVAEATAAASGSLLAIATPLAADLAPGDSLAVNGVCLTVVSTAENRVRMHVSPETLRVTTLGALAPGSLVNLERPLRANALVGGHFVQGHIDGTGALDDVRQQGDSYWIAVSFPPDLAPLIVRKGSIAVDGISLTVASVEGGRFGVQIIPFTWTHTRLHSMRTGDPVNLESDILGRYVLRAMELRAGG